MSQRLLVSLVLGISVGCGKPSSSGPTAPQAPEPLEAAQPAFDEAQMTALLGELTQAVRKYGAERRRAPKSLEELAEQGYLETAPQAPPGKKFAINKKLQVYLVDQ